MGAVIEQFNRAFRDFNTDGIAASGLAQVDKADARAIGPIIEQAVAQVGLGALISARFATLAAANASLAYSDGAVAIVYADPTTANNDLIVKVGASGTGNWAVSGVISQLVSTAVTRATADAQAAANLSGHYANDNLDQDVPGGPAGSRGAPFWVAAAKAVVTAVRSIFRGVHGGAGGFYAVDDNQNIGWFITPTIFRHPDYDATKAMAAAGAAAAGNSVTTRKAFGSGEYWATDANGYKGWGITPKQIYHPTITSLQASIQAAASGSKPAPSAQWDSIAALGGLMHFQIYGQSNAGVFSTTPVNSAPVTYAKKFSSGVFPTNGTGSGSTLDNLYESGQESPASGAARMIAQLLLSEDGFDISSTSGFLFFSDEWSSSKKASDLAPGSLYFDTYLVGQRTNAKALADTANRTYASGGALYPQGEADYSANTTVAAWQTTVRNIRATMEAGFQGTSSLSARPLPMVIPQTSTHLNSLVGSRTNPTIALAQLGLAAEDYFAMFPTHFLTYQADGLHFDSISAAHMAAYWGLYLKRWIWDRAKPAPGLAIKSVTRLGSKLLVTMDVGTRNLVLDSTPGVANYGITLDDGAGNAIAVSDVAQTGRTTFEIQAAASIPSGAKLRNAWIGNGFKGQSGIRDDQGKTLIYDPTGLALPMHNWAPISETTVA